ncbi:hypothetical protein AU255_14620 [Methyloprofundus sedimenti]|uniref:Uncharacterized protein n=1 Tax=Methyloprofundus sedimenti TaxID=1420851 RepID=A0A1V8M1M2_9GAMM|nr:hypothetical protein AU255_14620 [Methyloprofundus sedimenti]
MPTDNAIGNLIYVAERVRVQIALGTKERQDNPLQRWLSIETRIQHLRCDWHDSQLAGGNPAFAL